MMSKDRVTRVIDDGLFGVWLKEYYTGGSFSSLFLSHVSRVMFIMCYMRDRRNELCF